MQAPNTTQCGSSSSWDESTKYKTLFDSIDEGFCVVKMQFDGQGKAIDYVFTEVNPAFERQTGLLDAVGRSMKSLAPDHEEHWFRIYGDVARTGKATRFEEEARALGRWYDVYAFAFGPKGEDQVGILFNDVSRRKELEHAVELKNQQLQAAALCKDAFLATLSHELRNPLASLSVAAELLGQPGMDPGPMLQARQVIRRQVRHMTRLVDDLLDIARVTQGQLELKRDFVRSHALVDTAIEAVRPLIERKQHTLEVGLDPADPWLYADKVRLEQVISNLLANAAKYTDAGGHIRLDLQLQGNALLIRVQDNGMGLAPHAQGRLFEMFSQSPGAPLQAEGGLGVGLYLVRQLVGLHGGSVQAHSEGPGRGSTFTVSLPVTEGDRALDTEAHPWKAEAGGGIRRRILVVDDNRDAADVLADLLAMEGHQVCVAYDGPSALAQARGLHPDAAILDIGMPVMDGHALAAALRSEDWAAGLVLIAATGWGDEDARAKTSRTGFNHHLTKPINLGELTRILDHPAI